MATMVEVLIIHVSNVQMDVPAVMGQILVTVLPVELLMTPKPSFTKWPTKLSVWRQLVQMASSSQVGLIINVSSVRLSVRPAIPKLITVPQLLDVLTISTTIVTLKTVCHHVQEASTMIMMIGHAKAVMLAVKYVMVQALRNAPNVKLTLTLLLMSLIIRLLISMSVLQPVLQATMKKIQA